MQGDWVSVEQMIISYNDGVDVTQPLEEGKKLSDKLFPKFLTAFPPDKPRTPFTEERHGKIAERIPDQIVALWKDIGFGAHAKGLVWLTDPVESILDPDDWNGLEDDCIEVLRTAFDNILVWQNHEWYWLSCLSNKGTNFGKISRQMLEYTLTDKSFRKDVLMEKFFKECVKKHGLLTKEECYGFAPYPSLGGAIAIEYSMKTEIRPYLALVSQTF